MIRTCRVCLDNETLTNIFQKQDSIMISIKIMSLANVHIHPDDGLPSLICAKCLEKLDKCYKFKTQCEYTDNKLRELAKGTQEELNSDSEETTLEINEPSALVTVNLGNDHLRDNFKTEINYDNDDVINNSDTSGDFIFSKNLCKETKKAKKDKKATKVKINSKEKGKQKEQCFTCGKVMSSRFRLKTHLLTHTKERPFPCTHCNKKFSSAQNLKVHLRIHTGEKPLQCTICGVPFAHTAGLAAHMRKHTGETPYHCSLCTRSFRTHGHLQYHIRRHTGEKNFECEVCGRAFIARSDLKQHSLTHTGERRHVCPTCGLKLARASHLKRHLATHDRNKQIPCENYCEAKFNKKPDLEKHIKEHHISSVNDEKT